jgi:carbamoyl-phosphate synthase large subunit
MSANVLITAASRRVALVEAFKRALAASGGGRVIVTDINPLSPAVHVADRAYLVPLSDAPDYLDEIAEICTIERISLVVPTIDDELERFAKARDAFAAQGIRVAVSPPETCAICDDKLETCGYLRSHGIAAARSWRAGRVPADAPYPLFVKPRVGRGGVGAYRALDTKQLAFFTEYVSEAIVQEYLNGPEFTIDMLCDFDGRVLSVVPRERVVIRAGVIDRGRTSADRRLIDLAVETARALRFAGAVNLQCRVVDGQPTIFEINPRFSGGISLTIAAGADFPRMLVDLAAGRTVRPSIGTFTPDFWMTSYEASIFLDADRVRALSTCAPRRLGDVA